MDVLIVIVVVWGAICCLVLIPFIYSAYRATPYPCAKCMLRPATREWAGGLQICEVCYMTLRSCSARTLPLEADKADLVDTSVGEPTEITPATYEAAPGTRASLPPRS